MPRSVARAWRPTVGARLARTLGRRMQGSYASIHLLLHDVYREGKALAAYAPTLEWAARSFLDKATLIRRLESARITTTLIDTAFKQPFTDPMRPDVGALTRLSMEFFEPLVDDVLLISAFENMAKAKLLRRRYVVHEITRPRALAERQRGEPVHVMTINSEMKRCQRVDFKETTIGLATLLKPQYLRLFPLPTKAMKAMEEVRLRRNLVHFNFGLMWRLSSELIALADHLNAKIPKHRSHQRSTAA